MRCIPIGENKCKNGFKTPTGDGGATGEGRGNWTHEALLARQLGEATMIDKRPHAVRDCCHVFLIRVHDGKGTRVCKYGRAWRHAAGGRVSGSVSAAPRCGSVVVLVNSSATTCRVCVCLYVFRVYLFYLCLIVIARDSCATKRTYVPPLTPVYHTKLHSWYGHTIQLGDMFLFLWPRNIFPVVRRRVRALAGISFPSHSHVCTYDLSAPKCRHGGVRDMGL